MVQVPINVAASALEAPEEFTMPVQPPDADDIKPEKNHEEWSLPMHDEDDGRVRYWVKINFCPFCESGQADESIKKGKCTQDNWKNAAVWSATDCIQCLKYAMQHATHSIKHNISEEHAYDELLVNYMDLSWEVCCETWDDRERQRKEMARFPGSGGSSKRKADALTVPIGARIARGPAAESSAGADVIASAVQQGVAEGIQAAMRGQQQQPSQLASWDQVGTQQPSQSMIGNNTVPIGAVIRRPVQTLNLSGEETVTMPISKLRLIQDYSPNQA